MTDLKMIRPPRGGGSARKARKRDELLYFAYGSNLNVEQMQARCPGSLPIGAAELRGYKLCFRGVADVAKAKGERVHGGLWSITPRDLVALDRYEGFPRLYTRHWVTVLVEGKPVTALVYRMTKPFASELGLPSPGYLRTCLDGFTTWGLPHWVMRAALKEAGRYLLDQGVTELVPRGKRMVPKPTTVTGLAPTEPVRASYPDDAPERRQIVRSAVSEALRAEERELHQLRRREARRPTASMTRATMLELGLDPDEWDGSIKGRRLA